MELKLTAQLAHSGSFWVINKDLAQYLTMIDIAVLMEHVYQYDKVCFILGLDPLVTQRVFYELRKKVLCEQLMASRDTIHRIEEKLLKLGLLTDVSRRDAFSRANRFAINSENIQMCFSNPEQFFLSDENRMNLLGIQRVRLLGAKIRKRNGSNSNDANQGIVTMQTKPTYYNNSAKTNAGAFVADLRSVTSAAQTVGSLESKGSNIDSSGTVAKTNSNIEQNRRPANRKEYNNIKVPKDGPSATALQRTLLPETIEIVNYWNSMPNLKKQVLKYSSRTTCRYALQFKYIQHLDNFLKEILAGTFYSNRPDMDQENLKYVHFTVNHIKIAIERFNRMATFEYTKNPDTFKNYPIHEFFFKPAAQIYTKDLKGNINKERFSHKYPFIHCMMADPTPLSERESHKSKTEYPMVVTGVIQFLKSRSSYTPTTQNYNTVVNQVNRAIAGIKANAKGSAAEQIIRNLPRHLANAMKDRVHIDNLYSTVEFKLIPYLRQVREIK